VRMLVKGGAVLSLDPEIGDRFEEARVGLLLDREIDARRHYREGRSMPSHGRRMSAREALEAITLQAADRCVRDRLYRFADYSDMEPASRG
jgi:hypothetical protein